MTYLFNELKPKARAHWWIAEKEDTACTLWSTGGINQRRPGWVRRADREARIVCQMCRNALLDKPP